MIREIKFREYTAIIEVLDRVATLIICESSLPLILADTLDEIPDLTVTGIEAAGNRAGVVRMEHTLQKGELLSAVCDAIGEVYDSDTFVSFSRSSSIAHFVQ